MWPRSICAPSRDNDEELRLHGRVVNLPARCVSYRTAWVDDDYLLEVAGEVRQARVFGENLVLRRRISTWLGSNRIEIEDSVTNEGFLPQPDMILYHFNLGFPLVGANARLQDAAEQSIPREADAQAGLAHWSSFQPPTPGYREQVFRYVPKAGRDGNVRVALENLDLGLELRLTYEREQLPHLFQWKMMGEGTYVLGIEPTTAAQSRAVLEFTSAARAVSTGWRSKSSSHPKVLHLQRKS